MFCPSLCKLHEMTHTSLLFFFLLNLWHSKKKWTECDHAKWQFRQGRLWSYFSEHAFFTLISDRNPQNAPGSQFYMCLAGDTSSFQEALQRIPVKNSHQVPIVIFPLVPIRFLDNKLDTAIRTNRNHLGPIEVPSGKIILIGETHRPVCFQFKPTKTNSF